MFDLAFERIFDNEGGFQSDRADRGNWTSGKIGIGKLRGTKFGLAAMTYPDLDIENLTRLEAKEIYRRDWWEALGMDKLRPAVAYQMFDAAINHGMYNATRIVQRALKVKADGIIGPVTGSTIAETDLDDLLMRFLAERLVFMTEIATWGRYGRGWARRIAHNLIAASRDN